MYVPKATNLVVLAVVLAANWDRQDFYIQMMLEVVVVLRQLIRSSRDKHMIQLSHAGLDKQQQASIRTTCTYNHIK